MSTVQMFHKDGRVIPVSSNPESIARMESNGFSTKKPAKKAPAKKSKKAEWWKPLNQLLMILS